MEQFFDCKGAAVRLAFAPNFFSAAPEHVLVICRYQGAWLLTNHKERGWEFPGGKKETGETLEEAAHREVFEETGAVLRKLVQIGEYQVQSWETSFVKAIFYAEADQLTQKNDYLETDGPILEYRNILEVRLEDRYSFIMKDDVIKKSILYIEKNIC